MAAVPEKMRQQVDEALSKSADEMVSAMKAAAPRRSGELRDSIKKTKLDEEGRIAYRVGAGEKYGHATTGRKWGRGWYIRFVEFGTKAKPSEAPRQDRRYRRTAVLTKAKRGHAGTRAQPFFWPTYRKFKSRIRGRVTRALRKGAEAS